MIIWRGQPPTKLSQSGTELLTLVANAVNLGESFDAAERLVWKSLLSIGQHIDGTVLFGCRARVI